MPRILISNDDGIYGEGLIPLVKAMMKLGEVVVVVPDSERSAASHSITLHKPFRARTLPVEIGRGQVIRVYVTNGTPSDCVRFGVLEVFKKKKLSLIVGGINAGANLGEDTAYSGTVAVAREGCMMGIPSFAASVPDHKSDFNGAARICSRIAGRIFKRKLPSGVFLNVNIPSVVDKKTVVEVTRLGKRIYGKVIPSGIDPRGHPYYWLAGDIPTGLPDPGTDLSSMHTGKVSVTPLKVDSTDLRFMPELASWGF